MFFNRSESKMDGTKFAPKVTLGDVVVAAMRQSVSFGSLRLEVGRWLCDQGRIPTAIDRVVGKRCFIRVTYWPKGERETVTESFEELPEYTYAQPLSTW